MEIKVFNIVVLVCEIFFIIFSIRQYRFVKKQHSRILYEHQRKSLLDAYGIFTKYSWIYFIIACMAYVMDDFSGGVFCYVLILLQCVAFIVCSITVYMITEIKHISPEDAVSIKIQSHDDISYRKEAYYFYIKECIVGLFFQILILYQLFSFCWILGILTIINSFFVLYFGMADVLQHDNYNSENYADELKNKDLLDKILVKNILSFIVKKDYRKKSVTIANENMKNIKKGIIFAIKITFKSRHQKSNRSDQS